MTRTAAQDRIRHHTGKIRDMTDLLEEIAKLTPQKNAIEIPAKIISEELCYLEHETQQLSSDLAAAMEIRNALDAEVRELQKQLSEEKTVPDSSIDAPSAL